MAELVDALVSGTSVARRGGSSPLPGTIILKKLRNLKGLRGFYTVLVLLLSTFYVALLTFAVRR